MRDVPCPLTIYKCTVTTNLKMNLAADNSSPQEDRINEGHLPYGGQPSYEQVLELLGDLPESTEIQLDIGSKHAGYGYDRESSPEEAIDAINNYLEPEDPNYAFYATHEVEEGVNGLEHTIDMEVRMEGHWIWKFFGDYTRGILQYTEPLEE